MDSPVVDSFLYAANALALSMARAMGCAILLPAFGRRHMAGMQRNALCMAISLPQTWLVWNLLEQQRLPLMYSTALAFKEALIGAMLGFLLSIPFWAFRSAGTLIDNQRGANAAQQINPSLEADSSILGELCERALIVFLIEIGVFKLIFDVLADSYVLWPVLAPLPQLNTEVRAAFMVAFSQMMASAMLYSAPVLLLLLAVEYLMAIGSTVVQGLDVYQAAMPVKTMLALLMLVLCFPGLVSEASLSIEYWWTTGVLKIFVP